MAWKRHAAEEIILKLREAEIALAQGRGFETVLKQLERADVAALIVLAVTAGLAGGAGIMSLIPRVRTGAMRPNLLFFGVHSTLSSEEFHRRMGEVLADTAAVHDAIVEDVHQMGQVLSTKFRLINVAYAILLAGLTATTITYLLGL